MKNDNDKISAVIAEMYEQGEPLMAIATEVGKPKSTVFNIIQRLIASGVVEHRERLPKQSKPVEQAKPVTQAEGVVGTLSPELRTLTAPACKCSNDDITEFVKGLLLGAKKVVVYRKGATVTVDFTGGE